MARGQKFVRSSPTPARPYTSVSAVELNYRDADRNHPTAAALVGNGLMFALSDGRGLIGHREPKQCVVRPRRAPGSGSVVQPAMTRDLLHESFADWHAGLS